MNCAPAKKSQTAGMAVLIVLCFGLLLALLVSASAQSSGDLRKQLKKLERKQIERLQKSVRSNPA